MFWGEDLGCTAGKEETPSPQAASLSPAAVFLLPSSCPVASAGGSNPVEVTVEVGQDCVSRALRVEGSSPASHSNPQSPSMSLTLVSPSILLSQEPQQRVSQYCELIPLPCLKWQTDPTLVSCFLGISYHTPASWPVPSSPRGTATRG
jgi:hypothetical protein